MFSDSTKNLFGLDISDRALRLVQLQRQGKKIVLTAYNELGVPADIIDNGEIKQEAKLIELVQRLIASAEGKKIKTKNIVAVLPEAKTFIKVATIPTVDPKNIDEAVKEELKNHIPLDPEEIYFDWQIIKSTPKILKLLIGAAPKETVDSYFSFLEKSGLTPCILEIEAAAIIRSLISEDDKQAKIIIDFGAVRTGLIVYDQGTVQFTVSLPISGNKITQTISSTINLDNASAEKAKIICGLDPDKCEGVLLKILLEAMENLVSQIKKAIAFYASNFPGGNQITEIIICGGGANFVGIDKVLSEKLKLPVKIGLPTTKIKLTKKITIPKNKTLSYTTAIGLALRAFQKEN